MKAALYRSTGAAKDVLSLEEIDRPEPGPGDVRVRISVSGVNPTDVKARSGAVPRPIRGFQVPAPGRRRGDRRRRSPVSTRRGSASGSGC